MPDPFERHSRASSEWDARPPRSQQRAAAADDDPARSRVPGKKNPDLCKAAHWKEPHRPVIRLDRYADRQCKWDIHWWKQEIAWVCYHEEACAGCGKILRHRIPRDDCPDRFPLPDAERDRLEAWIARRREEIAAWGSRGRRQPKPAITGPQGYRRRRD